LEKKLTKLLRIFSITKVAFVINEKMFSRDGTGWSTAITGN